MSPRRTIDNQIRSMMAYLEPRGFAGRGQWLRWSACGLTALTMHAGIVLAIASHSDDSDLQTGASVVMMELAPISAAPPAPLSELAPGPQQTEAEQIDQVKQERPKDQRDAEQIPELPREPDPVVALQSGATVLKEQTPQTESREVPETETKEEIHQEAAIATAPPSAVLTDVRPVAPAPGQVERPTSTALLTWERSMVMQLERHKRYPPQAQGEHGVAILSFTVDHQGHLLSSRIVRSSGSAILDAAALAMLSRAEPFPAPPPGITDELLSITVPIRYSASAQR
jgi:periplasmic protein TonB